jgi:hypothetical protein
MKVGISTATLTDVAVRFSTGGPGGEPGSRGSGASQPAQRGISAEIYATTH